jgi:hypothetical protein
MYIDIALAFEAQLAFEKAYVHKNEDWETADYTII